MALTAHRRPSVASPQSTRPFAERHPKPEHDATRRIRQGIQSRATHRRLQRYRRLADQVLAFSQQLDRLDDTHVHLLQQQIKQELRRRQAASSVRIRVLGLVHHTIHRVTGLSPYPTQLIAAQSLLDGALAEMQTGEGKSLAILMAATTAALTGVPVHVLTANDYLATRDAELARPVAARLGLTIGLITSRSDPSERRLAYRSEILFTTAREIAFDYLRDSLGHPQSRAPLLQIADRLTRGRISTDRLLTGLHFAIIDEADSILLDEAITPFILSRQGRQSVQTEHYRLALNIANEMTSQSLYAIDEKQRRIHLTDEGRQWLASRCADLDGLWRIARFRDHLIEQALAARWLFHRDRDYLVRDDKIQIIDPVTGRLADGRQWSHGIHQLLELKESVTISSELEQLAKITYQQLFPRYLKLAGASGTLTEDKRELLHRYDLTVIETPLRQPSRRRYLKTRLFRQDQARIEAIRARVQAMIGAQRAVLVATGSVEDSHKLSARLNRAGIEHVVLNARQDAEEAEIIAQAGQPGRVTVATNMAGRGADIKLHPSVAAAGGLHIIRANLNSSRRIDRQVEGRCARNGQPGSVEALLALSDPTIERYLPYPIKRLAAHVFTFYETLPGPVAQLIVTTVQKRAQIQARWQRQQLINQEKQMRRWLAIRGKGPNIGR